MPDRRRRGARKRPLANPRQQKLTPQPERLGAIILLLDQLFGILGKNRSVCKARRLIFFLALAVFESGRFLGGLYARQCVFSVHRRLYLPLP